MAVLSVSLSINGRDNRSFNYQAVSKRPTVPAQARFTLWHGPKTETCQREGESDSRDYNILATLICEAWSDVTQIGMALAGKETGLNFVATKQKHLT